MTAEDRAEVASRPTAVLAALDQLPYSPARNPHARGSAELTRALNLLAGSVELLNAEPRWWIAFDEHARRANWPLPAPAQPPMAVPAWRTLLPIRPKVPGEEELLPFWHWSLAVCAADGRTRQAALAPELLPVGQRALIPLLVVRCADWAAPVRAAAQAALADVLAQGGADEPAWAAVMAWTCERRHRGEEAVRIVVAHLLDAAPDLWRGLLEDPDYRVRRRALAQAVELNRCDSAHLLALAVSDPDVLVAQRAAEHLLHVLVPPGTETPATPQAEAAIRKLLASRVPGVRAASVTVLRRAQRPDLAAPFTADRSAQVREVARWVLRKHGQDPTTACRARLARPAEEITPGAVAGLAECGDHTDVQLLRAQLTHQRSKVRAAVLYGLGTMKPPAITTPELLVVMDQDPAPGVLRTAVALLAPDAGSIPRHHLDGWLAPGRPAPLRAHAARLLRVSGTWNRLEVDLRLLHDTDAELAREARQDIHLWWTFAAASARQPADEQRQALVSLLQKAVDAIDARSIHRIHFVLAHAEDAKPAPEARTITR
jgi:HEAT repeat protein